MVYMNNLQREAGQLFHHEHATRETISSGKRDTVYNPPLHGPSINRDVLHEAGANLTAALRLGHNVLHPLHLPPFTQNRKEMGEARAPTNPRGECAEEQTGMDRTWHNAFPQS